MIDKIYIHNSSVSSPVTKRFVETFPKAEVHIVSSEKEISGDSKRAVYIAPRCSSFVSRFSPDRHQVCAPFWKFTAELGCALGCHYCFLLLTLRFYRAIRVASNIEQGIEQAERVLWKEHRRGQVVMFNIGELADGRHLDLATGISAHLLPLIDKYPNGRLYVLSKSGKESIQNYLNLAHLAQGRVVHAASVTAPSVVKIVEPGNPSVEERLESLLVLKRHGYRVRVRIDPIIDTRDLGESEHDTFKEYDVLAEEICDLAPELVTLGSFRPDPLLIRRIATIYPHSPILKARTVKESGRKLRLPTRVDFYRRIAARLKKAGIKVALCKEPVEIWNAVELSPVPLECGCLPLHNERRIGR